MLQKMRLCSVFIALLALAVGGLLPHAVEGGTATGSITGVIYRDLNGDGVRQQDEPLFPGGVALKQGTTEIAHATRYDGTYSFSGLQPGEYTLNAVVDLSGGQCADSAFTFNPLQSSYCVGFPLPWHTTTADSVSITVIAGSTATVDFGVQPADVAIVAGIALLEDQRAPAGTIIEALFNGQECGTTTVPTGNVELNYVIQILGAGVHSGCASPGDPVHFMVGSVPAAESYSYVPFTAVHSPGGPLPYGSLQLQGLDAMEHHAWYWMERRGLPPGAPAQTIEAIIDGVVCGSTDAQMSGLAGFSRLIVADSETQPGCGTADATVSFKLGGVEAVNTVIWQPELQRIDLALFGDANCDLSVDAVDAALLLQFDAGLVLTLPCQRGADVNRDGSVSSIDAAIVLQFGAGLISQLPP